MATFEDIKIHLDRLGASDVARSSEIKQLPNILTPTETILYAISGRYAGDNETSLATARRILIGGSGIFVATTQRIIIISSGLLSSPNVERISYEMVESAILRDSITAARIDIKTGNRLYSIDNINRSKGKRFTEIVNNKSKGIDTIDGFSNKITDDTITQLERLAKLRDQGVLSTEEFMEQKRIIVNTPTNMSEQSSTYQEENVAKQVATGILIGALSPVLLPLLGCLGIIIFVNLFTPTGSGQAALPFIAVVALIAFGFYSLLRSRKK